MAQPEREFRTESTVRPISRPIDREERSIVAGRLSDHVPVRQAYNTLHLGFTVAPIVAGLDKFFHVLVNWDQYLAPIVPNVTGINGHTFMQIVGVIEVVAGIGVAMKPRIFGYVVSAWLGGIIVNLLMTRQYYDIALRDLGLAMGAFALARLSRVFDRSSMEHARLR